MTSLFMNQAVAETGIDDSDSVIFQETLIFAVHRVQGKFLTEINKSLKCNY
jgi:hypothetical protein